MAAPTLRHGGDSIDAEDSVNRVSAGANVVTDYFEPQTGGYSAQQSVGGRASVTPSKPASKGARPSVGGGGATNKGLRQTNQPPGKNAKGRTAPNAMKAGGTPARVQSVKTKGTSDVPSVKTRGTADVTNDRPTGVAPTHGAALSNAASQSFTSRRGRNRSKPRTKQTRRSY